MSKEDSGESEFELDKALVDSVFVHMAIDGGKLGIPSALHSHIT